MKSNSPSSNNGSLLNRADKIGSVLSSLCAVHCMCMPVLIGLLPMIGLSFLGSQRFEHIACVTMVLLAAACIWSGCRIHRRWGLLVLLCAGVAMVLYIQFIGPPEEKGTRTDWHEAMAMVIGGSLIAVSHLLNLRLRARCHCAQCEQNVKK
jgi:MerC mercury resistance protein